MPFQNDYWFIFTLNKLNPEQRISQKFCSSFNMKSFSFKQDFGDKMNQRTQNAEYTDIMLCDNGFPHVTCWSYLSHFTVESGNGWDDLVVMWLHKV